MNSPSSSSSTARMRSSSGRSAPFAWAPFLLGLVFPGLGHASIGEKGRGIRIAVGFLVLWIGGMLIGGPNSVQIRNPAYSVPGGSARAMADSTADAQIRPSRNRGQRNADGMAPPPGMGSDGGRMAPPSFTTGGRTSPSAARPTGFRLWFLPQAGAGPIAFVTAFVNRSLIPTSGPDMIEVTMPDRRNGSIDRFTAIGHALDFGTLFCALAGLMNIAIALDAGRSSIQTRGDDRR